MTRLLTIRKRRSDPGSRASTPAVEATDQAEVESSLKRQREYTRRIAKVSRWLIEVGPAELADVIRESLGELAELVGADRSFLLLGIGDDLEVEDCYGWSRKGVPLDAPPTDSQTISRYRWAISPRRAAPFAMKRLEALPIEAESERHDLASRGVASLLGFPIESADGVDGYLSFEWTAPAERWPGEEVDALDAASRLFANAVWRCRAEEALQMQIDAAAGIADLARRFIELPSGKLEEGMRWGLAQAAALAEADRCYLLEPDHPDDERPEYEWHNEHVSSLAPRFRSDTLQKFRWTLDRLRETGIVDVPDADLLPAEAAAERARHREHGIRSSLGLLLRAEGRIVGHLVFESHLRRKRWSDREIIHLRLVAEIFGNVLHRKSGEAELARSRAELVQAQKMEAMGRMAGGIAHDFNNLLTVILGNSAAMIEALPERAALREEAEDIQAAAERAAALTRQLLSFTHNQPVATRGVDVNTVVGGLERMLRALLGERVGFSLVLCPDPALVWIDATQLEQIIVNLLINAREAVQADGRIGLSVAVESLDAAEANALGMCDSGEVVSLRVQDDGCGMDAATRARIFDPFFTTREPGQGTGLGLSIVYAIVQAAGGAIRARSERGEGSTFSVYLPRSADVAVEPEDDEQVGEAPPATILLVEDEAPVRRLTRRTLERAGYRVIEASDGAEGIEAARSGRPIDLLLSDVVMPRVGGVELARRLRVEHPHLPVLLMSGYPDDPRQSGPDHLIPEALLQKPFSARALLRRIAECLAEADVRRD